MDSVKINSAQLYSRLKALHSAWVSNRSSMFNGCDAICIHVGTPDEEQSYRKSSSLQLYLTGWELPDTILLLTRNKATLLASSKKCQLFESVAKDGSSSDVKLTLLKRNKEDGNKANFMKLIEEMRTSKSTFKSNANSEDAPTVGILTKEEHNGSFIAGWLATIDEGGLQRVDVAGGLGQVLSVKDAAEQDLVKKASVLTNKVLKHGLVKEMEVVIDGEKKISHEAFAQKVDEVLEDPTKINLKLNKDLVESCYFPIIQSGGQYDLKPSALSDDRNLSYDVIICSLGAKFKSYCATLSRTYFVNPPSCVEAVYKLCHEAGGKALEAMTPGQPIKSAYLAAKHYLESKKGCPALVGAGFEDSLDLGAHLPKNVGFAIGIEFRDSTMVLNGKNDFRLRPGMTFALSIGLHKVPVVLTAKESRAKDKFALSSFSVLISDTVIVRPEGAADVLTRAASNFDDVSYFISNEEEEEGEGSDDGEGDGEGKKSKAANGDSSKRGKGRGGGDKGEGEDGLELQEVTAVSSRLRDRSAKADRDADAAERERKQIEILSKRMREAARRNLKEYENDGDDGGDDSKTRDIQAYADTSKYPSDIGGGNLQVRVDMDREVVFLPIGGILVPFHIHAIKSVVMPEPDRGITYLRVNFYTPGQSLGKDAPQQMISLVAKHGTKRTFIKELLFRSLHQREMLNAYRQVLELRKRSRAREAQAKEEADLVEQVDLIPMRSREGHRVPRLTELTMRPQLSGRKTVGTLEAHENGFRFVSMKREKLDIMYGNIKHAFYQPCEREVMVLIHFHLKHPIMIGKKKSVDVQFLTEVVDASLNLDGGRRHAYDPDELDEENRERALRRRLNQAFKEFCKRVSKIATHFNFDLDFDVPYRDLAFEGTPFKEMVLIQPTVHCLVNLTDTPFMVVDLDEVEHIHFERITFNSKNFDLAVILKDLDKPQLPINSIEMKYLEQVQDWLTSVSISYTAGTVNLNWKQILAVRKQDPRFYLDTDEYGEKKEAGWESLRMFGNSSDEEGEDSSEQESEFSEPDEDDSEEEEDDDDDEEFSGASDEESEADASEGDDDDEEGESWEELEREAARSDKQKRSREDVEEDFRPSKNKHGSGGKKRRR